MRQGSSSERSGELLFKVKNMEFFKETVRVAWDESVKTAATLLVGMLLPAVFDRAKAALVVVGSKLADLGWWMREQTAA
jgi:hypothetical protein